MFISRFTDSVCSCLQEPISEATAVLLCHPGIRPVWSYGTVLFDGCFPYPVRYVKLCCCHAKPYRCDYIFYCGYQNCSVLVSWKCTFSSLSDKCRNKQNMYCTNVRNYLIKIHVFDYLTMTTSVCECNWKQAASLNVILSEHQLHRLTMNQPCFFNITCKHFGVYLKAAV